MNERWPLGGGVNAEVRLGRLAGVAESRHLVLRRLMREHAARQQRRFIDVGSDHAYPFYDAYGPTLSALAAAAEFAQTARHYPSSYGIAELRGEIASLMGRHFGVTVDPESELAITSGASQAFDALSRSYAGRFVLLPRLVLSTVESVSVGNGATVLRVPLDATYRLDFDMLERLVRSQAHGGIRFLYINSPTNPTGAVYARDDLARLVDIARAERLLLVHDQESWVTTHAVDRSPNILEVPGAMEVAVTVLSVSKELGLPGLRIAAVVGCREVVNQLRIHNSQFCVMIPEMCQRAAAAALHEFRDDEPRRQLQREISGALRAALDGLLELGWPESAIRRPAAGYKFLFRPPPAFRFGGDPSGVELFDFLLARNAAVKLSTSRSFDPGDHGWMRMIVMQRPAGMREIFDRLAQIGIHYRMPAPAELDREYAAVMAGHDLANL